jgi:spore coat protein U-like protein
VQEKWIALMMRLWLRCLMGGLLTVAMPTMAAAASTAGCSISASPVMFGNYDPVSSSDNTSVGSISATCQLISGLSLLVAYTITLSPGSGSYTQRTLTSGASSLGYNLYKDAAMKSVLGDGTGSTSSITDGYLLGLGNVVQNYSVYGKMPARQATAKAGIYTDSITVMITY